MFLLYLMNHLFPLFLMFLLYLMNLQCLKNLDQLPVTGAMIVSAPLKIKGGSGSPLRVLALIPS